jgi:ATPase family AAA domain-containing protein 3A/B
MSKPTDWNAESLEKAAKHLKELDKSVNAKAALELAKRDHDVEIAREATRAKEFELQTTQIKQQNERVKWEEQRKTLDHKTQNEKDMLQYKFQSQKKLAEEEDQLARRRDEDNRRRALEDERIKAGIRQKAGELRSRPARADHAFPGNGETRPVQLPLPSLSSIFLFCRGGDSE